MSTSTGYPVLSHSHSGSYYCRQMAVELIPEVEVRFFFFGNVEFVPTFAVTVTYGNIRVTLLKFGRARGFSTAIPVYCCPYRTVFW